jgi:putative FmdB family regulatory protein
MPVYEFRCSQCEESWSVMRPMAECKDPAHCPKCAKVGERNFIGEHHGTAHHAGNWPMKSEALGVHPDQIGEAVEQARKLGIPTEFTKDGRPILTSPGHRKRYAEALGFWDKNGGYSDPCRK